MWLPWRAPESVRCIACGERVVRDEAREYDKYGDRWERDGKTFEYLCKPCDRELCRRSRDGLESLLVEAEAGDPDQAEFVSRYVSLLESRDGQVTER